MALKTCNWNCVYCQLGRTKPLVATRRDWFPRKEILKEVAAALEDPNRGEIDWITFVASGETTLHAGIGWMVREVKDRTEIPVAVITNGSLLSRPEVREDLLPADAVLPNLDAGEPKLYRKVNRPHSDFTFDRHLEGLIQFRKEYKGRLLLETMLVRGLNDREEELERIAEWVNKIQPDSLQINTPARPPSETWVQPPLPGNLELARNILGIATEVIPPMPLKGSEGIDHLELAERIIGIVLRHPMRLDEIERILLAAPSESIEKVLAGLEAEGRIQSVERYGDQFWVGLPSNFPPGPNRE